MLASRKYSNNWKLFIALESLSTTTSRNNFKLHSLHREPGCEKLTPSKHLIINIIRNLTCFLIAESPKVYYHIFSPLYYVSFSINLTILIHYYISVRFRCPRKGQRYITQIIVHVHLRELYDR